MQEENTHATTEERDTINICMTGRKLTEVIKSVEASYLGHVLTEAGGNKRKAAEIAGLAPDTFRKKLALYSIKAVFRVA